jgi:hypothetical protein
MSSVHLDEEINREFFKAVFEGLDFYGQIALHLRFGLLTKALRLLRNQP